MAQLNYIKRPASSPPADRKKKDRLPLYHLDPPGMDLWVLFHPVQEKSDADNPNQVVQCDANNEELGGELGYCGDCLVTFNLHDVVSIQGDHNDESSLVGLRGADPVYLYGVRPNDIARVRMNLLNQQLQSIGQQMQSAQLQNQIMHATKQQTVPQTAPQKSR